MVFLFFNPYLKTTSKMGFPFLKGVPTSVSVKICKLEVPNQGFRRDFFLRLCGIPKFLFLTRPFVAPINKYLYPIATRNVCKQPKWTWTYWNEHYHNKHVITPNSCRLIYVMYCNWLHKIICSKVEFIDAMISRSMVTRAMVGAHFRIWPCMAGSSSKTKTGRFTGWEKRPLQNGSFHWRNLWNP